jgi:hypothetical protein
LVKVSSSGSLGTARPDEFFDHTSNFSIFSSQKSSGISLGGSTGIGPGVFGLFYRDETAGEPTSLRVAGDMDRCP